MPSKKRTSGDASDGRVSSLVFFLSLGRSLQGFLVSFSNSATTYYGDTFIEKSAYCTKISFYLKNWFSFGVNDIFFTDR